MSPIELPGNFPNPENNELGVDPISAARYPSIVYTEEYYNDPVKFETSQELFPKPLIIQSGSASPMVVRDLTQFLVVKKHPGYDANEVLSINTISPRYNKLKIEEILNFEFTEL